MHSARVEIAKFHVREVVFENAHTFQIAVTTESVISSTSLPFAGKPPLIRLFSYSPSEAVSTSGR